MELYLLRHAKALERGTPGVADEKRPLTKEGISKMKEAANGIKRIVPKFDIILASPLNRAIHTAQIVADVLQSEVKPQICNQLAPGISPNGLFAYLSKYSRKRKVLLVGHEPALGEVVSVLLGIEFVITEFKKGGLCRIDVQAMPPKVHGNLVWSLTPKILKKIAK